MTGYQVPKERAVVVLDLPPEKPRDAVLFLSPQAEHHHGQETVSDVLRGSDPFLPVEEGTGQRLLIRKRAVRSILIRGSETVEWVYAELKGGAPRKRVRFSFVDGAVMEGDIYATTPAGHQRVSDILNFAGAFIHFECPEGLYLVNLEHVTCVSTLEESDGDPR